MNQNDFLRSFCDRFEAVPHARLARRAARDPGQEPRRGARRQGGDGGRIERRIVGMDGHEQPRFGQGVGEGAQRPGQHWNAAQQAVLFGNLSAETRTASGGDNQDERIGAGFA